MLDANCYAKYVIDTYSKISDDFSKTRYKIWPCVNKFISLIPASENIFEAGCGNGKNFIKSNMIGIDICPQFVDICLKKNLNVFFGDILNIDFPHDYFDNSMSVAVIHHFDTFEKRRKAVSELVRVTKINGLIFILVWGFDSTKYQSQDVFIPFQCNLRFYHLFTEHELELLLPTNCIVVDRIHERNNYGIVIKKI